VNKFGNPIDFFLSATCNTKAAKRFPGIAPENPLPQIMYMNNLVEAGHGNLTLLQQTRLGQCPQTGCHRTFSIWP
jgi:hypothetical protein